MKKQNWGGSRKGAGRTPLSPNEKKKCVKIYITDDTKKDILEYGVGDSFSQKAVELVSAELLNRKNSSDNRKKELGG